MPAVGPGLDRLLESRLQDHRGARSGGPLSMKPYSHGQNGTPQGPEAERFKEPPIAANGERHTGRRGGQLARTTSRYDVEEKLVRLSRTARLHRSAG